MFSAVTTTTQACALPTYFIRHTNDLGIDNNLREQMWKQWRVGVHFPWTKRHGPPEKRDFSIPDDPSLEPDDYFPHEGKKAIRTLKRLATNGGYVCATHYPKRQYLVGKVNPHSPIELLGGEWGTRYPDMLGRATVMKTIRLEPARWIEPAERVALHVGHPQQGTINRWHLGELTVRNLVEGIQTQPGLGSLTPPQQEAMCAEALRLPTPESDLIPQLSQLLLPVGGTMEGIDIFGLASDGKRLFVQVTYEVPEKAAWKLDKLKKFSQDGVGHLLFICRTTEEKKQGDILILSLQKIFDRFIQTDQGRDWLRASL